MDCLSSVSYLVMINSKPWCKFPASKELRQGDPLSLCLFKLVVVVLNKLVERVVDFSLIKPLSIGRSCIKISQLQFADDTLFSSSDEESLSNLSSLLDFYFPKFQVWKLI